jgi:hypothetical protein
MMLNPFVTVREFRVMDRSQIAESKRSRDEPFDKTILLKCCSFLSG